VTGSAGQGAAPQVLAWLRGPRRLGVLRATRSPRSEQQLGRDTYMLCF